MARPLKSLFRSIRRIQGACADTRGRADGSSLRSSLEERPLLVVIGSGNSGYPARYLEFLLLRIGCPVRLTTALEYTLHPPRQPHTCLLFSQGARRRDSLTIEAATRRLGVPLHLVCGEQALAVDSVAARLVAEHGPHRVVATSTAKDRSFVSLVGTAAAFVAAYELAATLGDDLPSAFPEVDWSTLTADAFPAPAEGARFVLHSPAGRAAAEAYAGYHNESLGPVVALDMKDFTHGVWRGLRTGGRHTVYLVTGSRCRSLADFLVDKLQDDHDCVIVEASADQWAVEPFELHLRMLRYWAEACTLHHSTHQSWSPLRIDMDRWSAYRGINGGFDLCTLRDGEDP